MSGQSSTPIKMSEFFDSRAVSIRELLKDSGPLYKVPVLQRKYVWEEEEIDALLTDIKDSFDAGERYYFIGGMVFAKSESERQIVIDGQQRLITISLIIAAAIRAAQPNEELLPNWKQKLHGIVANEKGDPVKRFVVELHHSENTVFQDLLLKGATDVPSSGKSYANLIRAHQIVTEFIGGKVENLRLFMKNLLDNIYVVRTVAENQRTAFTLFDTLNNRGSSLQPEDLIKNLILKAVDDTAYVSFGADWDQLLKRLENKRGIYVVQVSTFLKHYIMSRGKYVNKSDIFDWFEKQAPADKDTAFKLLKELDGAAIAYRSYIDATNSRVLRSLKKLRFRQGYYLLLATRDLDQEDRDKIWDLVERIAFSYVIAGQKTNELERSFCIVTAGIAERKEPGDRLVFALDELTKILADIRPRTLAALNGFRYKGSTDMTKTKFLLTSLAKALDAGDYGEYEVEHIAPQNSSIEPKEEYDYVVRSLGNLTLLPKPDNASAKDKLLGEKHTVYAKQPCLLTRCIVQKIQTGTQNTKLDKALAKVALLPIAAPYTWGRTEVEARTKALGKLVDHVWFEPVLGDGSTKPKV